MIAHAIEAHAGDSLCTFKSDPIALGLADYTFASGVFNVKQSHPAEAWQECVLTTVHDIDRLSEARLRVQQALELLGRGSSARRSVLRPALAAFDYWRMHFSRRGTLLHDYPLYEFTILVRK